MEKFVLATRRFLRDEEGVTAIEYGLIAALIAIIIVAAVTSIGKELCGTFNRVIAALGGTQVTCPT